MDDFEAGLHRYCGEHGDQECLYSLAYIGVTMGEHWHILGPHFHKFDFLIGLGLAVMAGFFVWRHWPQRIRSGE